MARSTCTACGETFGGLTGFDAHLKPMVDGQFGGCRRGEDCGLRLRPDGVWVGSPPPQADTNRALSSERG